MGNTPNLQLLEERLRASRLYTPIQIAEAIRREIYLAEAAERLAQRLEEAK
jgi:hypothetical protein